MPPLGKTLSKICAQHGEPANRGRPSTRQERALYDATGRCRSCHMQPVERGRTQRTYALRNGNAGARQNRQVERVSDALETPAFDACTGGLGATEGTHIRGV